MTNQECLPGSAEGAGPIALTADDDEFFRIALKSLLIRQLGFQDVIETGSFDEALEKLAEGANISLALFDLQMPGLESPMNLQVVRENFPKTRVVVVSSSECRQDILAALHCGVHGYVPKSLGPADLASALRLVLQGTIFVPASLAELTPEDRSEAKREPFLESGANTDTLPAASAAAFDRRQVEQGNRTRSAGRGNREDPYGRSYSESGAINRAAGAVVGARLLSDQRSPRNRH